jgi:hypothetical protein
MDADKKIFWATLLDRISALQKNQPMVLEFFPIRVHPRPSAAKILIGVIRG